MRVLRKVSSELVAAIAAGNFNSFEQILGPDVDPNEQNVNGTTPLIEVVKLGKSAMFHRLLEHPHINVLATDSLHKQPLHYARLFGRIAMEYALLTKMRRR